MPIITAALHSASVLAVLQVVWRRDLKNTAPPFSITTAPDVDF
eukprot:CAMPEP_0119477196 /NCGR_PEP_ID=MMETSP1344-20130328/7438_1 /TAXON_ID=236787 /ORGANISM="Florenciella parvula, Strain CCMP2471" /LENGTH=42 /DNA_ID= /DNA_START= /DNA_END= /DNA_ORIENTATION=